MEKTKYLRTDFSRLFKKYPLYLAIVGVAVSFILLKIMLLKKVW